MPAQHALTPPSLRDHRAYRLTEIAVDAALRLGRAIARGWRRVAEERARARLIAETRHLDERLLRDIGLWDELR